VGKNLHDETIAGWPQLPQLPSCLTITITGWPQLPAPVARQLPPPSCQTNVTNWSDEELWRAYILWRTLGQLCKKAGLGDEPRRVISELSEIRLVDFVPPTDTGHEIRYRCVARPSEHQRILLEKLGRRLFTRIHVGKM